MKIRHAPALSVMDETRLLELFRRAHRAMRSARRGFLSVMLPSSARMVSA
jgi:hypothetical protein